MPFTLCSNFAGSSPLCAAQPHHVAKIAAINKLYLTEASRLTPSLVLRA
jgi:hypothetical protein